MFKINFGWVQNDEGKKADIAVPILKAFKPKNVIIGGAIITAGVLYLGLSAFHNGANAFLVAEDAALDVIGCINSTTKTE